MDERMQPLPESSTAVSAACVTPETEAWNKLGLSMIGQGKVAAILLAGGMVRPRPARHVLTVV